MSLPRCTFGTYPGEHPYARAGDAEPNLVILPGINDALQELSNRRRFAAWLCSGFTDLRTVHVISRRRGMPAGYTLREMAGDYAELIAGQFGRCDVLGISMGSAIAQFLAADHPDVVDRLVLALGGCRTPPGSAEMFAHWIELAEKRAWRDLYLDLIEQTYGATRRAVYQALLPGAERMFLKMPDDPHDFVVSVRACLDFDTRPLLPLVRSPALVLGGEVDRVMPELVVRELAEGLPRAELHVLAGAGHGAFEERKADFDRLILRFLQG